MSFLLDTCALSELIAVRRDARAIDVITALPRSDLYISVITIGELRAGIDQMIACPRKNFLDNWLAEHVLEAWRERTLPVDTAIALEWGRLMARLRGAGLSMQRADSLIAATALEYGFSVVTRNEDDFVHCGTRILNPWK